MLENKRVMVTGSSGFLGKHVVDALLEHGCKDVFCVPHSHFDLREREDVESLFRRTSPHIVMHLAAVCGGIGANQRRPGEFLYDNLMMGLQMIDVAREVGVEKFVQVGTVCAYPKFTPVPFKEEDLWKGYPEETNAPYGLAKKMLLVQCQAYRQQYGMNAIYLIPVNLYGPGDNFDLESSHVIPALIRKCIDAKRTGAESIEVWGTGAAYREFLYVDDCAEALVRATERYDGAEPINIGTGAEISMSSLVELIKEVTGYDGKTIWTPSKPDGQPRRCLDTSKAEKYLGFKAQTSLVDGVKETVEWYTRRF